MARLESGHTPSRKRPEYWNGGVPWIGIKDATQNHGRVLADTLQHASHLGIENSSARVLPKHTVCLSRTASVGYVVVMGRRMATSQDFVNWVCSDRLDWRFLRHVLLAEREALLRYAHGTTHQTIYFPEVKAFHVSLPPIEAQRAIASTLGALDDKIESNRRLEHLANSSWIEHSARALSIADTERVPVADLVADGTLVVNDGYRAKNSELGATGIPFLRARNLTERGLDLRGADRAPPELVARAGSKVSAAWDTAFTSKGTVGRITLIEPGWEPSVYSPQVCFWRSARPELLSPFVLHAWMHGPRFTEQVDAVKGQTDMADYVSLRDQRAMHIDLLDPAHQAEVDAVAEPMARLAATSRRESRTLTAIRDALLPKLVSGQIRVPLSDDPEEQVGAAVEGLEATEATA